MLKKCLTVIISLLITLIPVTQCLAANVTEIRANVDIYTVTVSATADAKGTCIYGADRVRACRT